MESEVKSRKRFTESVMDPEIRFEMVVSGRTECLEDFHVGPRTNPHHLIYYIEEGAFFCTAGSRSFTLTPERLFWVQPGVRQHFVLAPGIKRTIVNFFRFFIEG